MARRRSNGEGTIYKYDGGYRAAVTVGLKPDGTPIRKYVRAKTEKEARKKRDNILEQVESGYVADSLMTVSKALDFWIEGDLRLREETSTCTTYLYYIETFIRPMLGRKKLVELRPMDINRFFADLNKARQKRDRSKPYATATRATCRRVLRAFLGVCAKWGMLQVNPAIHYKEKRGERLAIDRCIWDTDQLRAFLQTLEGDQYEAYFKLLAVSGLRASEIRGLCWDSVDFDKRTIVIQRSLADDRSRRPRQFEWRDYGKSEAAIRRIPLVEPALSALQRLHDVYIADNRNTLAVVADDGHMAPRQTQWQARGVVFLTSRGTPVSAWLASFHLQRLADAAGLPHIRPHDLRHTFASRLIEQNVSDKAVQMLLGHSSIVTTKNIYAHVFDSHQQEAMETYSRGLVPVLRDSELRDTEHDEASIDAAVDAGAG